MPQPPGHRDTPGPQLSSARPRPPAGRVVALDPALPDLNADREPGPVQTPAQRAAPVRGAEWLYARFASAWSALAFAGQLPASQPITGLSCLRGGPGNPWWIRTGITLDTAREMTSAHSGDIYLPDGDILVRDRGWGAPEHRASAQRVRRADLRNAGVLGLMRSAGVHPGPPRPLSEAILLLPGHLVPTVVRRVLDLGLAVEYRPVELTPLFEGASATRVSYQVTVRAVPDTRVPASVIAALNRDPFILVCRRAAGAVLIRYQHASPLSDRALAALNDADATGDTWVLADSSFGCARMRPLAPAQDGTALIRRGDEHELTDVTGESLWTSPAESPAEPRPPALTLARARMSGVPVDAALLDDADLVCVPALLAGEPLAESAVIVRGRDRHLLTAPGGLLEDLPVGEPLYCLGPGSLYLPLGYRFAPSLPPPAREELFPANGSTAIVVLPTAALLFDLRSRDPVWTLWAGGLPDVDVQVPEPEATDLRALDRPTTSAKPSQRPAAPAPPSPAGTPRRPGPAATPAPGPRPAGRSPAGGTQPADGTPPRTNTPRTGASRPVPPPPRKRTWHDDAYDAELAGDLVKAAELHAKHHDPLRAARLFERAAEHP